MTEEMILVLSNDPEFLKFNDFLDQKSNEAMEEDGFYIEQYDEYEDGQYERKDSSYRR